MWIIFSRLPPGQYSIPGFSEPRCLSLPTRWGAIRLMTKEDLICSLLFESNVEFQFSVNISDIVREEALLAWRQQMVENLISLVSSHLLIMVTEMQEFFNFSIILHSTFTLRVCFTRVGILNWCAISCPQFPEKILKIRLKFCTDNYFES